MDRKIKNILIILVIFIIVGLSYVTMKSASNNTNNSSSSGGPNSMGIPPDMTQGSDGNTTSSENGQTPPSKPDDNNNQTESNGQGQTPPAKPDEDNNQSNSNNQNQSENGSKPSVPPSGQFNNGQGQMSKPDNNNTENQMPNEKSEGIRTIYYVLFALEAIVISALIVYLIMSNFNLKTLNETLGSGIKALSFAVIVIILGCALTFLQTYITNNYFITENSQSQEMPQGGGMMNGGTNSNVTYTATKTVTENTSIDGENYTSTTSNENGLLAEGDIDVTASNITVTKSGDSDSGDTSNFYGNNSAILAKDKANLTLKNITVTTNASGANGVFSYGGSATTNNSESDGTTVTISDSKITTTGDNAGGIMTTGGGNTVASNLTINTSGTSSAAIRTDRGGGTVTVDKGTYTTTGQGSPTIYSTADISVSNANLIAKASEGVVIEGSSSVKLDNCDLTDSNTKLNGQSTTYKNIFLYQSMSGDAKDGTAFFTANNCNITTNNGDTFYVTNTTAEIDLSNNTIVNNDSEGNFLRVQKDSWGNSGSNGGNVTLKMSNQKATGNIVIDSISTLDMSMESGSYYEGAINGDNQAKSITLKLDSSSKIKLTGDSYVSSLEDEVDDYSNIDFNGYTLYVNGVAIN